MLTSLQPHLVRAHCQTIRPLDRARPRRRAIRLWQRHRLHLGSAVYARRVWSPERRFCHGCERPDALYNGSRVPALYRADVWRDGGEMGDLVAGFCLHAHGTYPVDFL